MIKAAIFDMDGTLLDSMSVWYNSSQMCLDKYGVTVTDLDLEKIESKTQLEALTYFSKTYPQIGKNGEDLMQEFNELISSRYHELSMPKSGILDLLAYFKSHNIRMCVATLTDRHHSIEALKLHGILDYFDFIMTSGEIGLSKRNPDIYLQAASKLGFEPHECMVFEDAPYAAETAKKAGFNVCGISEKAYQHDEILLKSVSDIFIKESYNEVEQWNIKH